MAVKRVPPLDTAWIALESRDTPMHVGGLFEFTRPDDAPDDYLAQELVRMRAVTRIPRPWNLKLAEAPVIGPRLPLMVEERDVDLEYHVRHSALPSPGGQRELGVLVSRLHTHQLDLHRPLWEVHLIEGLERNRFAMYLKVHHSLIDGVSGMRLILRALSADPESRETKAFWTVGSGKKGGRRDSAPPGGLERLVGSARGGAKAVAGISRAAVDLGRAVVDDRALQPPYRAPRSALNVHLTGQRRFATQRYDLDRVKTLARAAGCSLNDLVLYLSGTALRRYLTEHARVPSRPLTAGIPVNLREAGDERTGGTEIAFMVAELGTNVGDPLERIEAIRRSTADAKAHLQQLPREAQLYYSLIVNGPYIAGLVAGLGHRSPLPFNVAISNVPGPVEPLYFNGARLDAFFPLSLLTHGAALNITCVSYAGTLNVGFTGARDALPHLQRLAIYMGEALDEIQLILPPAPASAPTRASA